MTNSNVDYTRGNYWDIDQMPDGRWVHWEKRNGVKEPVQIFDSQEEAEDSVVNEPSVRKLIQKWHRKQKIYYWFYRIFRGMSHSDAKLQALYVEL
jgi:hypothetical protein